MSYRGKQVLYNITYKRTLKKIQMNVQYIQNKNKLTGIENKLTLPNGRGRRSVTNQDYAINRYKFITRKIDKQQIYHRAGFPGGSGGKEPAWQHRRLQRGGFYPWVRKIPWRRERQPIPVSSSGESHGQRSLVGYNPYGHKESDGTEATYYTHIRKLTQYSIIISNEV